MWKGSEKNNELSRVGALTNFHVFKQKTWFLVNNKSLQNYIQNFSLLNQKNKNLNEKAISKYYHIPKDAASEMILLNHLLCLFVNCWYYFCRVWKNE